MKNGEGIAGGEVFPLEFELERALELYISNK